MSRWETSAKLVGLQLSDPSSYAITLVAAYLHTASKSLRACETNMCSFLPELLHPLCAPSVSTFTLSLWNIALAHTAYVPNAIRRKMILHRFSSVTLSLLILFA